MITSAFAHQSRGSPTTRRFGRTLTVGLGLGLFLTSCSPETPVEPSARANPGEVAELAKSGACRYSDNSATKTRTFSSSCGNTVAKVPGGWSARAESSKELGKARARTGPTFHAEAITAIANPDAGYVGSTNKIDISGVADFTTLTSVSDGLQTFSFSTSMEKRQVPTNWFSWGAPPATESSTPPVIWTQFVNSLTLTLSRPASVVGFELEPNLFDVFTFTVDFYSGGTLVGSLVRDVDGNPGSGALLFAGRSDGALIDVVVVSAEGDPGGFAIGQLRYSPNNTWTARTSLPTGRRGAGVTSATGILYAIGGNNSAGAAVTTNQAYNPSTDLWTTRAPLPAARQNGDGAVHITGNIYVPGGQDAAGTLTRTLYRYTIASNSWTTRANMPVVGGCGGSAVISGKLYVFSGCTRTTGPQIGARLLHRYTPGTNTWTTLAPAPAVHMFPGVAVAANRLYVIGGTNAGGAATNRVDVYNPTTNTWTTAAAMPTVRGWLAAAQAGSRIFAIGGRNGSTFLRVVQAYNPATNSWTSRAQLPTGRAELGAGVINGLIFGIGGRNSSGVLATNERYLP
jgi:hypothetical protein